VRYYIIAASLGDDDSLKTLREGYTKGFVSKEEKKVTE